LAKERHMKSKIMGKTRKLLSVLLALALIGLVPVAPAFAEEGQSITEAVEVESQESPADPLALDLEGEGTEQSPYLVKTPADLLAVSNAVNNGDESFAGKFLRLTNNIDLSTNGSTMSWTPIGSDYNHSFQGTFDGNGSVISGLSLTATGSNEYVGLFGVVRGAILKDFVVKGSISLQGTASTAGGVVAYATYSASQPPTPSSILNVGSEVGINAAQTGYGAVGGVVGQSVGDSATDYSTGYNTISSCYYKGAVTGVRYAFGGIAGYSYHSKLTGCYNSGTIAIASMEADDYLYVGGLVGSKSYGGSLDACYNVGALTYSGATGTNIYIGAVVGYDMDGLSQEPSPTATRSFYLTGSWQSDGATSTGTLSKTSQELQSTEFLALIDSGGLYYKKGATWPMLKWEGVAKDITSFVINGVEGIINGTDISVLLPSGTNVTSLASTITHTGASISPESGTAQNFTTPVNYTVTAGDSSTRTYTVTVTVAAISDVVVTRMSATEFSLRFNSNLAGGMLIQLHDTTDNSYTFVDAEGWNLKVGLNERTINLASLNILGADTLTLSLWQDGRTVWYGNYPIPAWNDVKANTKDITSFKIGTATGTITGTNISVTVPYATNVASLAPVITHSGVSITPAGPQNFTSPVTYTVRAEDGTTKAYTVTVSTEPPPIDTEWPRLDGNKGENGGRYDTMQAIVSTGWKDEGSPYVIVASGMNFPDALAASSLAGIYGAPVVLTESSNLTVQAEETIKDLGATKALVIGGEAAVSPETVQALGNIVGSGNVSRISGDNRIATALDIYEKGRSPEGGNLSWGDIAIIANGFSFADALSVSPFANVTRSPIFLSTPESMPGRGLDEATLAAITTGGFKRIIITGGTATVPGIVEDQLASSGAPIERWSGANRYETSAVIVENSLANSGGVLSLNNIVCATGFNYPDALAGGAFAGHIGTVLLLVHAEAEGGRTGLRIIEAHKDEIGKGYILGGAAAVPEDLLALLQGGAR
jgi:putative cell wall-binding protein